LFADALLLFKRGVHDRVVEPVPRSGFDDPKLPLLLPETGARQVVSGRSAAAGKLHGLAIGLAEREILVMDR